MSAGAAATPPPWADASFVAALLAVDPAGLGGAVLQSAPGPYRDAWLAALHALSAGPFRRAPAAITDDRLLGGLDLAATLRAGRPVAERGVLAAADGGFLVLAMAERLRGGVAAQIASALDQGHVDLQRDGLAARHATRFGVVALDEGLEDDEPVAPALAERLAFHLRLVGRLDRDTGLDDLAPSLAACFSGQEIAAARALLPFVEFEDEGVETLCLAADALGVESCRAPLLALRAARAAAALDGRKHVGEDDLALAVRLVLGPRATRIPQAAPEAGEDDRPQEREEERHAEADADREKPDPSSGADDVVLAASKAAIPAHLLTQLRQDGRPARRPSSPGKAGAAVRGRLRGRPAGTVAGKPGAGARLNLVATLRAAAPWQPLRRAGREGAARPLVLVTPDDFRVTRFEQRTQTTTIFVVDASGSSALHRLAEAKGAVELLLADCYVRRDSVALIAFRGKAAELLLPPTRSLVRARRCLSGLPGGGGTPLAAALDAALSLADATRRRGQTPLVVLLTDGKANVTRAGEGGRGRAMEDALDAAKRMRGADVASLLIDTSPRPQPQSETLAAAMEARYLPMPHARSETLSQAVRHAVA